MGQKKIPPNPNKVTVSAGDPSVVSFWHKTLLFLLLQTVAKPLVYLREAGYAPLTTLLFLGLQAVCFSHAVDILLFSTVDLGQK